MQLFRTYNVWLINWSFDGKKETRKDLIFGFMKFSSKICLLDNPFF